MPRGTAPSLGLSHDPALPISERREELLAAIAAHPVVIVAGDTGCGKSTQLPQYCLALGRGSAGRIGHTQPRRLAARALAARIADELAQPVGRTVGFRVRFADQVSQDTRLVLMTDGLLLSELGADPLLRRYDTIIVDEAHERSLNIDLLLGVLKRLLPRRPDLRVIVTSATLDLERMSGFFDGAPVITIGGRAHPVEVRHALPAARAQSQAEEEDPDLPAAVLAAFREIAAEPGPIGRGDVLVFLPGEREIRDVAELLERELAPGIEILSLYSRLSWDRQRRIFERGDRQRIVLSTNVAETSITVPGIRSVIDSGLARVSRYSPRSRLQRLPIERISRASALQRAGRCGRIGPGLCMRLYSAADFEARAAFTEPEVQRTNLAALVLKVCADGLGEVQNFPFIDPPDSRALNDGYRVLQELEALDAERRITRRGRAMARLPLDPHLARALLESQRWHAERELLVIVAGLSVPDPRIDGVEAGAAATGDASEDADVAQESLADGRSEFSALYKLWGAYRKAREGTRRELRAWCRRRRLSLLRLSEWEDVHAQILDRAEEIGIRARRAPASYAAVHRALLAGFCTNVGVRGEEGEYLGTRGIRFHIFPGSPLRRRKPRWVMAAHIVETSRVYARRVAQIEPVWVEAAARHLIKREYLAPDWDEEREEVTARERQGFLGLVVSAHRVVNYGPIDPEASRLIFAREALAHGRLTRRPDWLRVNDAAIAAAQRIEERLRVRDLIRAPEWFAEFYAARLPRQVSSGSTLEHFSRHLSQSERCGLALSAEDIFARAPDASALAQFPETARVAGLAAAIDYRFAPGEPGDGACLNVPLLAVPLLTRAAVEAAIPGLVQPRIEAMLRSLPKDARRRLAPVGGAVAEFLALAPEPVTESVRLTRWLAEIRGVPREWIRFDATQTPAHLTPHLRVLTEGAVLDSGDEVPELRRRCAAAARAALDAVAAAMHGAPWQHFLLPALEERVEIELPEGSLTVYPTLRSDGQQLCVRFEWTAEEAAHHWRNAAVLLARRALRRQVGDLGKRIAGDTRLLLAASSHFSQTEFIDTLLQLAVREACFGQGDAPRERGAFEAALERGRGILYDCLDRTAATAAAWFEEARAVRRLLEDPRARSQEAAARETRTHLAHLLSPRWVESMPADWLRQLPRYLKAEQRRWQRLLERGAEAALIAAEIGEWTSRHAALAKRLSAESRWLPELQELGCWIEEYRVSLYAQELKTVGAVSAARLRERAAQIEAWLQR